MTIQKQDEIVKTITDTAYFNLTTEKLNRKAEKTLGLGLNFVPKQISRSHMKHNIITAINSTARAIRLAMNFGNSSPDEECRYEHNKPHYKPKKCEKEAEAFISLCLTNFKTIAEAVHTTNDKFLVIFCEEQEFIHEATDGMKKLVDSDLRHADKKLGPTKNSEEKYVQGMNDAQTFKKIGHSSSEEVRGMKKWISGTFTKALAKFLDIDLDARDPNNEDYKDAELFNHLIKRCHEDYIAPEL
jgi:hypothetical protein